MSPELINNIATFAGVLVAGLGAFLFAFWVAMGIWTFNDIRSRTRDWLAILLAVLLVLVFPIVGLILYTMIRPKATLAEVYDRALEEEALLRELEETQACPTCGTPVKEGWIFCPNCHGQLQHSCPACSNLVRNEWAICVYCGASQRPSALRESARDLQPSYQPAGVLRPAYDSQSAPQLGSSTLSSASAMGSTASAASLQPAPRRTARSFFTPNAPVSTAPPQPAPALPDIDENDPLASSAGDFSDYPDYDDNPYRPARAGEG